MPLSNAINYRFYSPGDESGIIDLLKISFPGWKEQKNALQTWRWKYLESPIKPMIRVVEDGNRIIAVDHKIIIRVKIGESIHLATYSDDVAVHSDYRSRGIYSEMLNFSLNYRKEHGLDYAYYSTTNPIVTNTDNKYGFKKFPCHLSHLVKIFKNDEYLKAKNRDDNITKLGVKVLSGITDIKQTFSPKIKGIDNYSIKKAVVFDDRINTFWEEVKESYSYIIEKKLDYLNWRIRRPTENNEIRLAVDGNRILGYIVIRLDKEGDNLEGKISDLLTIPNRLDVADALIKNVCTSFESDGAAAVYFPTTKGHPYDELVQRNGFIDASKLKTTLFYYYIQGNKISNDYIENLSPSKVQLQHF